ncbi:unnamed protein product [Trifolium pratense]|uniref:Uncharacterized protein n=1 Tax=Trifolium pratense TaxID=57577 RepID=A0ACB0JQ88_TRIPR|nr:unnamed protein product [Trifolium pratense]
MNSMNDVKRLKPGSSEVEVDLSVDLESSNINSDVSNNLKYTKQTLSTTWKPPAANGCAVGLLMGDNLHLHPLHAVVQLRPSRHYINSGGAEKENVAMSNQNNHMEPSTSGADKVLQLLEQAGFLSSDVSSRYFQQMATQENSTINFELSLYDYIATLCPGVSHDALAKGPSKRYLLSLPVEKRLETLLIDGPTLHRFSAIKHFAPEYSNDELLSFLQQHAQLLQGYWVPKSRLLSPKGGPDSLARNYVLVLFNKRLKVMSADVLIKKGELANRVKNFLMQFALETKDLKGVSYWKFKELPDVSFIKKFPNVVKQQEEIFKILDKEVSSEVEKYKSSKSVVRKSGVKNAHVR